MKLQTETANIDLSTSRIDCRPSLDNIEIILFDLDDTLIDTLNTSYKLVTATAKQLNLPVPSYEEYRKPYGGSFPALVEAWFPNLNVDANYFRQQFERNSLTVTSPILFNVVDVFLTLRNEGYRCGIVTNSGEQRTLVKLKHAELTLNELDCIVTSTDTNNILKPAPDSILLALKKLNVSDPKKVLYVGNAYEDQIAAHAAEVVFCGVNQAENWHNRIDAKSYFLESAGGILKLLGLNSELPIN